MCLAINVCVLAAIFLSLSPEECGLSCTTEPIQNGRQQNPWPSASYSYPCLRHFRLREVTRKVTNKHKYICRDSTIYYTINKSEKPRKKISYACSEPWLTLRRHDLLLVTSIKGPRCHINVWHFCIRFLQIVSMQILVQFSCVITRKMSCSARLFQLHYAADFSLYVFLVPFPRSTF